MIAHFNELYISFAMMMNLHSQADATPNEPVSSRLDEIERLRKSDEEHQIQVSNMLLRRQSRMSHCHANGSFQCKTS
jgi:hypothetical protein